MEQERLSDLYEQYKDQYRFSSALGLSELVHDALAIEHYPKFEDWFKEYGGGRTREVCWQVFLTMKNHRLALKQKTGNDYERFIYAHRGI